jgi:hypothetical protein
MLFGSCFVLLLSPPLADGSDVLLGNTDHIEEQLEQVYGNLVLIRNRFRRPDAAAYLKETGETLRAIRRRLGAASYALRSRGDKAAALHLRLLLDERRGDLARAESLIQEQLNVSQHEDHLSPAALREVGDCALRMGLTVNRALIADEWERLVEHLTLIQRTQRQLADRIPRLRSSLAELLHHVSR